MIGNLRVGVQIQAPPATFDPRLQKKDSQPGLKTQKEKKIYEVLGKYQ